MSKYYKTEFVAGGISHLSDLFSGGYCLGSSYNDWHLVHFQITDLGCHLLWEKNKPLGHCWRDFWFDFTERWPRRWAGFWALARALKHSIKVLLGVKEREEKREEKWSHKRVLMDRIRDLGFIPEFSNGAHPVFDDAWYTESWLWQRIPDQISRTPGVLIGQLRISRGRKTEITYGCGEPDIPVLIGDTLHEALLITFLWCVKEGYIGDDIKKGDA